MKALGRASVAQAGRWFLALEEADLQQGFDPPADLGLAQAEIAMADERSPVDREGTPQAPRPGLEAAEERGEGDDRLAVLERCGLSQDLLEDRTWQAVAGTARAVPAGRRRGVERTPARSQARARQHKDVLVLDDGHSFPFGLKARRRDATHAGAKLRRCGKLALSA